MTVSPIQLSFSAGELDPKMVARHDLPKLAYGCETLQNMLVYAMGPSFRRPGTEYIATVKASGTARLVPFPFSSDDAYIIEVGDLYMRFYRDGGQILSGGLPYELVTTFDTDDDVFKIQHEQTADLMYMVHNDYWPQKLTRSGHTSWTIADMDVIDGPFLEPNITDITITPSGLTGSITLTASSAIFNENHVGALWRLTQNREGTNSAGNFTGTGTSTTLPIERGTAWKIVTHGTWTGTVAVERSYDAGVTWEYIVGGDYADDGNLMASDREEQQDAIYRVNLSAHTSGTMKYNLNALSYEWDSVVKITGFTSTTVVTGTVLDPMPRMLSSIGGLSSNAAAQENLLVGVVRADYNTRVAPYRVINPTVQSLIGTKRWAEGAWSPYRGHPSAITFFQQRLALASSGHRLPRLWLSESFEFEHYNDGALATDGMTFVLATSRQDPVMWLADQSGVLIGTSGSEHILAAPDGGAIKPGEFNPDRVDTVAGAQIQPVMINKAVIFVEKGGRRLRQMGYSYENEGNVVEDLNTLAHHITDSGIIQIAAQRRPQTIIWAVLDDGTLVSVTYDRVHRILAWASHPMTNGSVESVAVIPGDDEDEVWLIVSRTIGSATKRYVERMKPHDWGSDDNDAFFVDSGLSFDGGAAVNISGIAMASSQITITVSTWPTDGDGDDIADGNTVKLSDIVGTTELNDLVFAVSDADVSAKTFKLKDNGNAFYWDGDAYTAYVSGGTVQKVQKTFTTLGHLADQTVSIHVDGFIEDDQVVTANTITLNDWANVVHIGLPYTSELTTNDIEMLLRDGSTRGRKKKISEVVLDLYKTGSCKIGRDADNLTEVDFRHADDDPDVPTPLFTGVWKEPFNGVHTANARITVVQDKPLPLTVRALIPTVTIN